MTTLQSFNTENEAREFVASSNTIKIRIYNYYDWEKGWGDGGTKMYAEIPTSYLTVKPFETMWGTIYQVGLDGKAKNKLNIGWQGVELAGSKQEEEIAELKEMLKMAEKVVTLK